MLAKRMWVCLLSAAAGLVITLAMLAVAHALQNRVGLSSYGYGYFALTVALIGGVVLTWLDYYMKTGILPR
jgi:hypothetical protein